MNLAHCAMYGFSSSVEWTYNKRGGIQVRSGRGKNGESWIVVQQPCLRIFCSGCSADAAGAGWTGQAGDRWRAKGHDASITTVGSMGRTDFFLCGLWPCSAALC